MPVLRVDKQSPAVGGPSSETETPGDGAAASDQGGESQATDSTKVEGITVALQQVLLLPFGPGLRISGRSVWPPNYANIYQNPSLSGCAAARLEMRGGLEYSSGKKTDKRE